MQLKPCPRCKLELDIALFCKDKQKKDGLSSYCKSCRSAHAAKKYAEDPERHLSRNKRWAESNKERMRDAAKAYRKANLQNAREYQKEWNEKNPGKAAQYAAAWRERNADRVLTDAEKYRKANAEKVRQAALRWQRENRARVIAYNAARYAAKLKATPKWANLEEIAKFYEEAERLAKLNGESYDVDHVVPLRSKIVCGLHCEANLRVIKSEENRSKGNRHWPDMP